MDDANRRLEDLVGAGIAGAVSAASIGALHIFNTMTNPAAVQKLNQGFYEFTGQSQVSFEQAYNGAFLAATVVGISMTIDYIKRFAKDYCYRRSDSTNDQS